MNVGKDGYYRSTFRFDGKVYTVVGKTEAEVHRKIGKRRADLEAGRKLARKKVTVRQYAQEWLDTYYKGNSWYNQAVKHIKNDLGDKYMKDITESTLQQFLNKKAETYSKSYLQRLKLTLRQIFRKARKNHIITDDPSENLKVPDCKEGHRRAITPEERESILAASENHRGRLFIRFMLYCGLRPQEAAALQWKHVDLTENVVRVRQARKYSTGEIGPPKSSSGVRDIPIPEILRSELSPGDPEEFVCSWNGEVVGRQTTNTMWNSIKQEMRKSGFPVADDLDLYCLRHTYCTDLQKAGVPINIARELMGHSSIHITAQIYTHTGSEEKKSAVALLDKHLKAATATNTPD